jgi:hypothetical protein
MKEPELVTATQEELDEILLGAKPGLTEQQFQLLEGVLGTFAYVMLKLQNAKTSIKRLHKALFGARTEHKKNVLAGVPQVPATVNPDEPAQAASDLAPSDTASTPPPKPKLPGHGRIAAQAYSGAPIVECDLPDLASGDRCPECETGRVYDSPPKTVIKMVGQAPLGATAYRLHRLRCRLCDAIYTAPLPAAVAAQPKHDPTCASMIAILRFGNGMPHNRIEDLQASMNMPAPDATQSEILCQAIPAPAAVYDALTHEAAQAGLLHADDTQMKVLKLMGERKRAEANGLTPVAKAINTSGIVAVFDTHQVALYFTGHHHAGNIMERVLAHRAKDLEPPLYMCDALASNTAGEFKAILCNCLTHGRRQFVDIVDQFPAEASKVIETLAKVYENDAACRKYKLSPQERLTYHQKHSKAIMDAMLLWMNEQFKLRQVEPNSGLGKAFSYMINHWHALTQFLRVAGAPLDNNLIERALKRAILHRKNSMFYKTVNGAEVGDIYMSLIHTCRLCSVNPFEYLTALHRNALDAISHAALWLPWNFRERLAGVG